jgi:Na+-driven multidrug efflux pump
VLSYAEWEILTVFAAVLGPAEVLAWTLLASIWDIFESTTGAIGSAAEMRCAYQLGAGRPALAKLSAYKSIFLAAIGTLVVTALFVSLMSILPAWLSHDATIQAMLFECFPLIAVGNITMDLGMVCWSLVGSQGRYKLATTIATATTVLVTLPIGAALTLWLRIDLQGLVRFIFIYSFTNLLNCTL